MAVLTLGRHNVHFPRIPIFRVFYSLTYTLLYLVTLVFIAITPISMIYTSIQQNAIQYTTMIGGAYTLTAILAVFVYSGRLYTNRSSLSAVGKTYIAVEDGEIPKSVRRMVIKQLHRSAIVAWESRPRDLYGEIIVAEQEGFLPQDSLSMTKDDYLVGREIRVDPQNPPWGDVQHPGWSSPSQSDNNKTPHVQFDNVIAELPHLIEARAVSLAPQDPLLTPIQGEPQTADAVIVDALKRSTNMSMREYLTQLSYLGVIPPAEGQSFLSQYERARFAGKPVEIDQFDSLMAAFATLLAGMTVLETAVVDEIRAQSFIEEQHMSVPHPELSSVRGLPAYRVSSDRSLSPDSNHTTPVNAPGELPSPAATPFLHSDVASEESLPSSVIHRTPDQLRWEPQNDSDNSSLQSSTWPSEAGSVVRHDFESHG